MPLYFFHLRNGVDTLLDPEGRDMAGLDAAQAQALAEARALISHEALSGEIRMDQWIDIEDGFGHVMHRLAFSEAVKIRGGA